MAILPRDCVRPGRKATAHGWRDARSGSKGPREELKQDPADLRAPQAISNEIDDFKNRTSPEVWKHQEFAQQWQAARLLERYLVSMDGAIGEGPENPKSLATRRLRNAREWYREERLRLFDTEGGEQRLSRWRATRDVFNGLMAECNNSWRNV